MAYIGNTAPSRFVSNRAATQFSGNGSNKIFTLEQVVTQDEDILVSVDGVIQEPSVAYVVSSGTTLTFQGSEAPSANSGNNIFVYYLASQTGTVGHPSTQGLTATTGAFSSNATVGGTLGVTGVSTLTGAVNTGAGLTVANVITLTDGNLVVASGHGIDFSAASGSASGSSSAVLDDYEEGSFTPAYSQSAGNILRTGRYTKVGNMVTIFIRAQYTQTGSSTALGKITGLPFTVLAETGNGTAVFREFSTTGDVFSATIAPNNTETNALRNFDNAATFTAGAEIGVGLEFSYRVA